MLAVCAIFRFPIVRSQFEVLEILSVQLQQLPVLAVDINNTTTKDAVLSKVVQYVKIGLAQDC